MSALHLTATILLILSSFGSGMQRFDGKPAAPGAATVDAMTSVLVQPVMSIIGDGGVHLSPEVQWLALGANSLTGGVLLGVLLVCAFRFGHHGPS